MQCLVFRTIPVNWNKLKVNQFYRLLFSKLKNIVTKMVEIQVKQTLGLPDIAGVVLGSISSFAPLIFKQRIRALMRKIKINPVYQVSK